MTKRMMFFLDCFPQKTETFIHNELIELKKKNIDFYVISLRSAPSQWVSDPVMKDILEHQFMCLGWRVWLRGVVKGLLQPKQFFGHLYWILGLNHKNWLCRLRVVTSLLAAYGMKETVSTKKIDYFHAHFASYPTEVVMCLSRITGIPFGATWHAFDIYRDANILLEKICYAEQIITCTQYNLDHLKALSASAPAHLINLKKNYHGVDFSHLPEPQVIEEQTPFLAVGRLVPKKGFSYLIDAIGLLKSKGIIVNLNIVGFPKAFVERILFSEEEVFHRLQKKIKGYGLEKQVKLLGFLPQQQVLSLMSQSYALIMPSIQDKKNNIDGIPNVILEAMAMERPVIASRISGIPEVVFNEETGLLVEPRDVTALANAIVRLLNDVSLSRAMGKKARAFICSTFKLEETMDTCFSCFSAFHQKEAMSCSEC
ncbi:MAG: glycosyltransferase family 4 protein [Gammaproteobacteria bacterium]|nr:glycosyltransferase family 4 protein [Gammaproteobacteria bacterium]